MIQDLEQEHVLDGNGNPAGGWATAIGLEINWQDGALGRGENRKEPNGTFVETVITAVIGRLEFYQTASDGRFACAENAVALGHLGIALDELKARTTEREARNVEVTHIP